jgi:hypothetical protein
VRVVVDVKKHDLRRSLRTEEVQNGREMRIYLAQRTGPEHWMRIGRPGLLG